ncbi:MAG: YihY/virulence factor BrkB family protein [Candidatus Kapaibacterium sp.]
MSSPAIRRSADAVRSLVHHIMTVGQRLERLHIFLLAAGISFNVALCVFPVLLVGVYVAGRFVDVEVATAVLQKTLYDTLPATQSTRALVVSILDEIQTIRNTSSTAGFVGLIVLVWTSSALFSSLRTGLNAIFSIPTPKFFLVYKLKDLAFTIVIGLLILLSTFITPVISLFSSGIVSTSAMFGAWSMSSLVAFIVSTGTAFLFFAVILRFVPNKPQPMYIIVFASATSSVLWELARGIFTYYLNHIASFGRFYGTFSVLVAASLWMYYSALIILVSAEVAEYLYELRQDRSSPLIAGADAEGR